ncbi:uncharacterized domain 1-containing protein [Arboricoccus pini]|uniref:Uncharacterized domain 1-containing protein n=1 Tax=Arboricoccus pini TaxID=1963835 RepID=A0A212RBY9_9PROT|nr:PaaI family thioesterase [Arboricoccus pini]SNB69730.1 uncharacterized domain 1-containing protein [Arboricoccus pini]
MPERTYAFEAPPADRGHLATLDGLSIVRGMLTGDVPPAPIWQTVGLELASVEEGLVVCEAGVEPWILNFRGVGQGGWLATLLDTAMGLAILTTLPQGRLHATLELSTRYIRPVVPALRKVRVTGRVLHAGHQTATAEGDVRVGNKLFAHGQTTCIVFDAS